jgi:hypothetical protein
MIDKLKKIIYALPFLLMGCASWFPVVKEPSVIEKISGSTDVEKLVALDNLTILSGIGGICLLGGMVLVTISRGDGISSYHWRTIINSSKLRYQCLCILDLPSYYRSNGSYKYSLGMEMRSGYFKN